MEQEVIDKLLAIVAQTLVSAVSRLVSARQAESPMSLSFPTFGTLLVGQALRLRRALRPAPRDLNNTRTARPGVARRPWICPTKTKWHWAVGLRHGVWGIVAFILPASVAYGASGYVGSKVCAGCHMNVYRTFSKTDMGRSLSLASNSEPAVRVKQSVVVHNEKLDRYFDVHKASDGIYQSEYQLNADGSDAFRNTQKLAYAIGSGRNGTGYLVERGGFLFEAPLSYYSRTGAWAMSPGFEEADVGFNRPVLEGCVACHSGLAEPVPPGVGEYRNPPFKQMAIGCENCHGPGALHVAERSHQAPVHGGSDRSIVNPAKLDPWLADNICMKCHQGTALRILQPGKSYHDFRPGTPLNETMAIFAAPLGRDEANVSPLLEHFTLMSLSKCYIAMKGRMSCLTCHDPHVQPEANTVEYFRNKCLTCHVEASCKLPLSTRQSQSPSNDCAGCHMPKRSVTIIAHSVLTDHRIVKTKDQPFPTALFNSSKPLQSGLIHLNAVPGRIDRIPALTLFRAFAELAPKDAAYRPNYLQSLDEVARTDADNPEVLSALAWMHLADGPRHDETKAFDELSRAVAGGTTRAADYEKLADLLSKSARRSEAISVLEKGIKLAPSEERLYKKLSLIYISDRQYGKALETMRGTVQLFPEDGFMRELLRKAEQGSAISGR